MRRFVLSVFCLVVLTSVTIGCGEGGGAPVPPENPTAAPTDLEAANGGDTANMAQAPPD